MSWVLRYASHLGYRSSDAPLFLHSVGSLDPVAHVDFAADLGFAGIQYALAVSRPDEEIARVASALERRGLEAGCILFATLDVAVRPLWGSLDERAREERELYLGRCFRVAQRLGARRIAILSGADPRRPLAWQHANFIENLKRAAEAAARAGVILCLESMSRRSLPGMLVPHIHEAYAVVSAIGSANVRLIFDTSHVQIMDGDVIENLQATWSAIEIIQLADNPGRGELGSGELNFDNILRAMRRRGYSGLVELEHGWIEPGRDSEQRAIENIRRIDGQLQGVEVEA
jgi:hydroxypyruvate isomerase